jgi:pyridinium-3,5-bisthiocarboxylic acid mononucleotide nickel chelatase
MKIIYFDPVIGMSGDMAISALIDAGCPFTVIQDVLAQIPLAMPPVQPEKQTRGVVEGTFLRIGESDIHLSPRRMVEIVEALPAEDRVKGDAKGILDIIIDAEAKVHGTARDEVHFHELASIDTLIDVVSVARAVAYFDPQKVFSGPVPHGRGFIHTHHGVLPNPPPATVEIMQGIPVIFLDEELELTTPTGAAIIKYYTQANLQKPSFVPLATGCGFGSRQRGEKPNMARVFVGTARDEEGHEETWLVEADVDDAEMEYMGAVADRIRTAGALDVLYFPVYMKKGRVGLRLSVITTDDLLEPILDLVFRETTTFGLRFRKEQRRTLGRQEVIRETSFGPLRVKQGFDAKGELVKSHIEFEDVRQIAESKGIPYRIVLDALKKEL